MAASKATLRGEVTQYLYTRDGAVADQPDYIITAEADNLDGTGALLDNIATGMVGSVLSNMVAGHQWINNSTKRQLVYNPKTDQYGVIPNGYSVYK